MRQLLLLALGLVFLALAVRGGAPLTLWLVLSFAAGPVAMTLLITSALGVHRDRDNSHATAQESEDE